MAKSYRLLRDDGCLGINMAMNRILDIEMVRSRRNTIATRRGMLAQEIDRLDREDADLEATERVFESLGTTVSSSEGCPEISPAPGATLLKMMSGGSNRSKKPGLTPTVPEMILEALRVTHTSGSPGLEGPALLDYVRRRWWPEALHGDVVSAAWRMAKDGRLVRNGKAYALREYAQPVQAEVTTDKEAAE